MGLKWLGQRATTVISVRLNGMCRHCQRVLKPDFDRRVLKAIEPYFAQADAVVTWYGIGFDEKYLNTRRLVHRLKPLPPVAHVDGWRTSWQKLKLRNNRLATLQGFLNLPDEKTALKGPQWTAAQAGELRGLRYVERHCRQDVKVLEQTYLRLLPLMGHQHPVFEAQRCHCGGRCQRRGVHRTRTRLYQRFQCTRCGGWSRGPRSEKREATNVGI